MAMSFSLVSKTACIGETSNEQSQEYLFIQKKKKRVRNTSKPKLDLTMDLSEATELTKRCSAFCL